MTQPTVQGFQMNLTNQLNLQDLKNVDATPGHGDTLLWNNFSQDWEAGANTLPAQVTPIIIAPTHTILSNGFYYYRITYTLQLGVTHITFPATNNFGVILSPIITSGGSQPTTITNITTSGLDIINNLGAVYPNQILNLTMI